MKHRLLLFVLLLAAASLAAQYYNPYLDLMHSSRCADGNLRVRWADGTGNFLGTECYYSSDGAAWQTADVQQISGSHMEAPVPYEFGQTLRYRLRTEISYMEESFAALHTPYLTADAFPPALNTLGLVGTDATGDSVTVYAPVLDLTGSWCAATEDKFYFTLGNAAGSFPTMNSITSYNVYGVVIANPETVADTLAYAMLYTFNIPGVISPGLYKARIDPDSGMPYYELLGSIQSQILGGKLYLACNMDDLTGDPDFGPWPSTFNALAVSGVSMRAAYNIASGEIDFGIGDYSTPSALFFVDNVYDVDQNTLPQCTNLMVNTGTNTVSFDYWDAEGDFPLQAKFVITDGPELEFQVWGNDFAQTVHFSGMLPYLPDSGQLLVSDNDIDVVQTAWSLTGAPQEAATPAPLSLSLPNPLHSGTGLIKLEGLDSTPLQISLYDLRGRKLDTLYQGQPPQGSLELPWKSRGLSSGIYLLRVTQAGKALTRRFALFN